MKFTVLRHALDTDVPPDQGRQACSPANPEDVARPSLFPGLAHVNLLGNWTL